MCELLDVNAPESGEECFKTLPLADGSLQYLVDENDTEVKLQLQLPAGQTCERCVLRWHYRAGITNFLSLRDLLVINYDSR